MIDILDISYGFWNIMNNCNIISNIYHIKTSQDLRDIMMWLMINNDIYYDERQSIIQKLISVEMPYIIRLSNQQLIISEFTKKRKRAIYNEEGK